MNKSVILLVNDWWSQLTSTSYSCELFVNTENLHQEILDYLVTNIWLRSIPHSEYGLTTIFRVTSVKTTFCHFFDRPLYVVWTELFPTQIHHGDLPADRTRAQALLADTLDQFFPRRYIMSSATGNATAGGEEEVAALADRWAQLAAKPGADCVRILLTCTRKWSLFGATLFDVKVGLMIEMSVPLTNPKPHLRLLFMDWPQAVLHKCPTPLLLINKSIICPPSKSLFVIQSFYKALGRFALHGRRINWLRVFCR